MFIKYSYLCTYIALHIFTNLFMQEKSVFVIPKVNWQETLHWSSKKNSFLTDTMVVERQNNQLHIFFQKENDEIAQMLNVNDAVKIVCGDEINIYHIIDITTSGLHTLVTAESSGKLIKNI